MELQITIQSLSTSSMIMIAQASDDDHAKRLKLKIHLFAYSILNPKCVKEMNLRNPDRQRLKYWHHIWRLILMEFIATHQGVALASINHENI